MRSRKRRRWQDDETYENSLWSHQRIAVFGQEQNLGDADLHRCRGGDVVRTLAGLALQRIDGVEADIDPRALRHQAFDELAVGIFRAQQLDARAERDDLDRDLVGVV